MEITKPSIQEAMRLLEEALDILLEHKNNPIAKKASKKVYNIVKEYEFEKL